MSLKTIERLTEMQKKSLKNGRHRSYGESNESNRFGGSGCTFNALS